MIPRFAKGPIRIRYLLVLSIGVFAIAWFGLVADRFAGLEGLERQEQALRHRFERAVAMARYKESYKAQKAAIKKMLESLSHRFPDRFEVGKTEGLWGISSRHYNVKIQALEFGPETAADFYARRVFLVKAIGSFRGLHDYLYDYFYASGDALRLADFGIESLDSEGRLMLTVTGLQYRYVPEEGE